MKFLSIPHGALAISRVCLEICRNSECRAFQHAICVCKSKGALDGRRTCGAHLTLCLSNPRSHVQWSEPNANRRKDF